MGAFEMDMGGVGPGGGPGKITAQGFKPVCLQFPHPPCAIANTPSASLPCPSRARCLLVALLSLCAFACSLCAQAIRA